MATIRDDLVTLLRLVGAQNYAQQLGLVAGSTERLAKAEERANQARDKLTKNLRETVAELGLIAAVANEARLTFNEFLDTERRAFRFQQVLRNLGREADQDTFQRMAEDLSRLTGVDDDLITSMQQTLLQFRLTTDQIRTLTPAILDLAQSQGLGLEDATNAVARALIGQGRALRLILPDFKATGNQARDLAEIQRLINARFGDTARLFRDTMPGAVDAFTTELGNLRAAVGKELEQDLRRATENLIEFVRFLKRNAREVADAWRFFFNPFRSGLRVRGTLPELEEANRRRLGAPPSAAAAAAQQGFGPRDSRNLERAANAIEDQNNALIRQVLGGGGEAARRALNIRSAQLSFRNKS